MHARYDTKLLPDGLRATGYRVDGAAITVDAKMNGTGAACPECGCRTTGRHGHYVRRLADLPGQINRLKMLKRQMYGAAGIDLLLARLQHSA